MFLLLVFRAVGFLFRAGHLATNRLMLFIADIRLILVYCSHMRRGFSFITLSLLDLFQQEAVWSIGVLI